MSIYSDSATIGIHKTEIQCATVMHESGKEEAYIHLRVKIVDWPWSDVFVSFIGSPQDMDAFFDEAKAAMHRALEEDAAKEVVAK